MKMPPPPLSYIHAAKEIARACFQFGRNPLFRLRVDVSFVIQSAKRPSVGAGEPVSLSFVIFAFCRNLRLFRLSPGRPVLRRFSAAFLLTTPAPQTIASPAISPGSREFLSFF